MDKADKEFRDWFDQVLEVAHKIASEKLGEGGEIMPHLMVFAHNRDMVYIPVQFETVADKNRAAGMQRALASNADLVAGVVLTTEAWAISRPKDPLGVGEAELRHLQKSGGSIENHPDRQEVMLWNACRGRMQLLAMSHIDRNGTQPTVSKPEVIDLAEAMSQGRMVNDELDTRH